MRGEMVKFLEYLADRARNAEKSYRSKHNMEIQREKAFALQSAADDIRFAVITVK